MPRPAAPGAPVVLVATDELQAVAALALLLISANLAWYAWKRFGGLGGPRRPGQATLSPIKFAAIAALILVLAAGFTALWGAAAAPLALAFGAGVALSLADSTAAAGFLIAMTLIRPWEITSNPAMLFIPKFLGALCGASWLYHGIRGKKLSLLLNRPVLLYLLFAGWTFLSAALKGDATAVSEFTGSVFVNSILFLLVANILRARAEAELARQTVVLAISGVALLAMVETFSTPGYSFSTHRLEGFGMAGNANDLAALIVMAAPLALIPALRRLRTMGALVSLSTVGAVLTIGLLLTQSRGGLLALATGLMAYALCRAKRPGRALGAGALVLLATLGLLSQISGARHADDLEGSSASRFGYAVAGAKMMLSNPVFGVGFGNYPRLFESYAPSMEYEWGERTAHSSWVLAGAETGLVGLLLFAALFASVLRRSWAIRHARPEYFAATVSYGVAMSFLSHTYLFFPYLLFALVLGAEKAERQASREQAYAAAALAAQAAALAAQREAAARAASGAAAGSPGGAAGATGAAMGILAWLAAGAALIAIPGAQTARAADAAPPVLEAGAGGEKPQPGFEPPMGASLALKGSRGETLNFKLRARPRSCASLSVEGWKAKGEAAKPAVRFYAMPAYPLENRSFPSAKPGVHFDPLIPLEGNRLCPAADGQPVWVWGELEIPRKAQPGEQKAEIALQGQGKLPLALKVWRMTIPEKPALPAYSELSSWYLLLGHHGEWAKGEEELSRAYADEMRRHRLMPVKSWVARPPTVAGKGGAPALDLRKQPSPAASFEAVTLRDRPTWAHFDFPSIDPKDIPSPETPRYFKAIEASIQELARDGRPVGRAFVYLWDEPTPEAMPGVRKLARIAKENAPDLRVMVTTPAKPELEQDIDIYAPVMDQFDARGFPAPERYRELQKKGKEVWWYVSCMSHGCDALQDSGRPDLVIDRPSAYVRAISWLSMRYGIDAFLYYAVVESYKNYPKRDPWRSVWDFSGNGDGTLFYPARPGERGFKAHGPVPSIRLKLWREASFDAEYVRWMNEAKAKPDWWKGALERLAPDTRGWDRSYGAYQSLRDRIGDYLDQNPGGAP